MERYEASFEIDSRTDSYAARRILERVHDTVREESGSVGDGTNDATALLREFETLHEAVKQPAPGRLTITYERYGDTFED